MRWLAETLNVEIFIIIPFIFLGDGLPSMASVDIDDADSESSDLQKARKLYAELQAMSMESTGSTEVTVKCTICVGRNHQKWAN